MAEFVEIWQLDRVDPDLDLNLKLALEMRMRFMGASGVCLRPIACSGGFALLAQWVIYPIQTHCTVRSGKRLFARLPALTCQRLPSYPLTRGAILTLLPLLSPPLPLATGRQNRTAYCWRIKRQQQPRRLPKGRHFWPAINTIKSALTKLRPYCSPVQDRASNNGRCCCCCCAILISVYLASCMCVVKRSLNEDVLNR